MKAITILQPWASLIVHGVKDIENRTWPCPKKYIGQRVLIHAGANKRGGWELNSAQSGVLWRSQSILYSTYFDNLPFGSIIGSVEIVDCVQNHPSVWAEQSKGISPGGHVTDEKEPIIYNWVLANPVLFEKPIPAKGKLSFWESGISEEELIEHFKTKEQ